MPSPYIEALYRHAPSAAYRDLPSIIPFTSEVHENSEPHQSHLTLLASTMADCIREEVQTTDSESAIMQIAIQNIYLTKNELGSSEPWLTRCAWSFLLLFTAFLYFKEQSTLEDIKSKLHVLLNGTESNENVKHAWQLMIEHLAAINFIDQQVSN